MAQYCKALLSFMVILNICQALPLEKTEASTEKVIHDEAKETKYEDLRDHDLQESVNAGQSGLAWEIITHGGLPKDIWGPQPRPTVRPKRQNGPAEPMMDHMVAPPAAPIDEAYAQRLSGSAIAIANQLAGAKRQQINRVPGYGRKKRTTMIEKQAEEVYQMEGPAPIVNEAYAQRLSGSAIALANQLAGAQRQQINRVTGYGRKKRQVLAEKQPEQILQTEEPAPIVNEAYAQRLSGSAIAIANQLAGAKRQQINRVTGYGRKKRQTLEDEAILEQVFQISDQINAIEELRPTLDQTVKVKAWGETGLRSPLNQSI